MGKKRCQLLSDAQWSSIGPLLLEPKRRMDKRGRPWASNRPCLEGILWVFADRSGVEVSDRLVFLSCDLLATVEPVGRAGRVARRLVTAAGRTRRRRPAPVVGRGVSGRQLRSGEKGGSAVGKTKRGKGTKWMVLVDGDGLPLGVRPERASPGEATLMEAILAEVKVPPARKVDRDRSRGA